MIIWVASYPKSGNTWVRALLTSYYYTDDGHYDPKQLIQIPDYPNPKIVGKKFIADNTVHLHWDKSQKNLCKDNKVIFLKTHNALLRVGNYPFTTSEYTKGVIYIVRDPRNVVTSLKNHMDFNTYEDAFNFMKNENIILTNKEKVFSRNQYLSSWKMNYTSWCKMNDYKKIIIKYEDMLKYPNETFKKLVTFTNLLSNHENKIDEKKLERAILSTNFENMKKTEKSGQFRENVFSPLTANKREFFYLGPKNDWKTILDKNFVDKMNDYYLEDLKVLGYES